MSELEFENKKDAIFMVLVGDKAKMARKLTISLLETLASTQSLQDDVELQFDALEYVSGL